MERFFQYKLDHALFWLLTVFFHGYTHIGLIDRAGITPFVIELVVRNGLLALVIYFNLFVVIPRLSKQKIYFSGLVLIILSLVVYVFLKNAYDAYLYGSVLHEPTRQPFFHNSLYNLSIVVFYLAFAITLHLSKEWYIQREVLRQVEIEKLNAELEYLKAQINPHFLFNSFNTVFFQIDKENVAARETLSKFSDMLRYQLYECNGKDISVEKEVQYIRNYVELQRLRKDENYLITFSCEEQLKNFSIPPLLLLPFVENAFKHVSHFHDKKNEIEISMDKDTESFHLRVSNTKDLHSKSNSGNGGIGLKNVKRRLELLYKDRYTLGINETDERYNVHLVLNIES